VHHNPSPGPAGEKFVYGHLWVALAWLVRHPLWHTLSPPLRALLYVRAGDVPEPAKACPREFKTKLELAVEPARRLKAWLGGVGKALWLVADGGYAKRPFLRPVLAPGLVVFSRPRKDADLRGLPPTRRRRGQRGPPPTYGRDRIDLAKRAGRRRGWRRLECVQYGKRVTKTIQTFEATWRPAGGRIRVVIVREDDGWLPYFRTDCRMAAETILEVMADRGAIEQTFKDVKEVWGAGQQQVRNVHAGIGAWAVNLTMHSPVEAWAWARREEEVVDRSRSPWDAEERRPSHADKRKALQREILREELRALVPRRRKRQEFQTLLTGLLDLAP
jgi:Transposase DDE domain